MESSTHYEWTMNPEWSKGDGMTLIVQFDKEDNMTFLSNKKGRKK